MREAPCIVGEFTLVHTRTAQECLPVDRLLADTRCNLQTRRWQVFHLPAVSQAARPRVYFLKQILRLEHDRLAALERRP